MSRIALTAAALAAAAALGAGGAAAASAAPTAATPAVPPAAAVQVRPMVAATPTGADAEAARAAAAQRLTVACARIPNLLIRSEKLQARLAADASTRGSIAWLQARVEAAQKAGRAELVTVLTNRLEVRRALQEALPGRTGRLRQAQQGVCAEAAAGPTP